MTDAEVYAHGYRAGHDDGYAERRKLPWHAGDPDWLRGYLHGYIAGVATRQYAREHYQDKGGES